MNKSELIEKINCQKKYSNKICIIGLLPLTVVTVYVIFFLKKTSIFYENKIIIPCFVIIGIIYIGIFIWLMFRNIRKIGLVCPKCDKIINVNLLICRMYVNNKYEDWTHIMKMFKFKELF